MKLTDYRDKITALLRDVIDGPKSSDIRPGMWVQLANGWIVGPVISMPSATGIYVTGGKVEGRETPWQVFASDDWEFEGRPIGIREVIRCGWPNVASEAP